jgi:hypothetical protein
MSRKKNHRIALTNKFSIIAAHHWSKVTKGRITKNQKFQNLENGQKLQKAEKGGKIQCSMGKNPWKNISTENQKGGEKYPWAFFF